MAIRSFRRGLVVRVAVASALGASSLALAAPAQAAPLDDVLCEVAQLVAPAPLADALASGVGSTVVRTVNDLTWDEMEHLAEDGTTWVDECGKVFVVEHAAPGAAQTSVDPAPAGGVPGDVLDLSSRPGSNRTIYLDFDGGTHSGTRWRNGEQVVSAPYSVDADGSLSDAERAQIYLAWRVVAEDYAPFDVNVTTRQPDASALTRTSAADPTYGMPVVITATNAVGAGCGCGGMSYVGVFGSPSANDYQPAWVFTSGAGTGGYDVGQAVSHEVGHAFGLSHDGTDHADHHDDYHAGGNGWAPIMGSSYDKRASQWSTGEYAGADNTEDDIAIIARKAPLVADDHADGIPAATQIAVGTTTAGLIGTRADADAFRFTAGGPTTLAVAGPAGVSNLDARVTILGPLGQTLATVDAVADTASDASMAAVWSVDLPATPSTYTAVVDGTGHGDPAAPGGYSDYGSIGAYTVALTQGLVPPPATPGTTAGAGTGTSPTAPPAIPAGAVASSTTTVTGATGASTAIGFVTTRLPTAHVGRRYRAEIRFTGPVSEARVDWRLPRGLHWRSVDDRIVITGTVSKRTTSRFTAELSGAQGSKTMKYRLVAR